MRESGSWIRDRILLALDQCPSHGYELLNSLKEKANDLRLTTLYRWLHDMELQGLIKSNVLPGPHGPARRVYRLSARGESRLRDLLRDAIEMVLHFYDSYRHSIKDRLDSIMIDRKKAGAAKGKVLFVAVPRLREHDLDTLRFLSKKQDGTRIHIMGDTTAIKKVGIKFRRVEGGICDIPVPDSHFAEIWLSGMPRLTDLPRAIVECKRALVKRGILYAIAPFVYFDEPSEPSLGEFIRVTAVQLFPDLGVTEGQDLRSVFDAHFSQSGAVDLSPGLAVFWGMKK